MIGLAKQGNIPLVIVPSRQDLGEWVGQGRFSKSTGKVLNVKGCSSLVIKDFGELTDELDVIQAYIKQKNELGDSH